MNVLLCALFAAHCPLYETFNFEVMECRTQHKYCVHLTTVPNENECEVLRYKLSKKIKMYKYFCVQAQYASK